MSGSALDALELIKALTLKVESLEARLDQQQRQQQQQQQQQQQRPLPNDSAAADNASAGGGSSSSAGTATMPYLLEHEGLGLRQGGLESLAPSQPHNGSGTAAGRLLQQDGGGGGGGGRPREPAPIVMEVPMAATRVVMAQIVSPSDSHGLDICAVGGSWGGFRWEERRFLSPERERAELHSEWCSFACSPPPPPHSLIGAASPPVSPLSHRPDPRAPLFPGPPPPGPPRRAARC